MLSPKKVKKQRIQVLLRVYIVLSFLFKKKKIKIPTRGGGGR